MYVLMVDRMERWTMMSQLSAVIAATAGAKVDAPDLTVSRAQFDAWLSSPLETPPSDRPKHQVELEAALGVR